MINYRMETIYRATIDPVISEHFRKKLGDSFRQNGKWFIVGTEYIYSNNKDAIVIDNIVFNTMDWKRVERF